MPNSSSLSTIKWLCMQALDEAALKVLKAAEATKQLLQQKEEVLAEIRGEFEQKNKEVRLQASCYALH